MRGIGHGDLIRKLSVARVIQHGHQRAGHGPGDSIIQSTMAVTVLKNKAQLVNLIQEGTLFMDPRQCVARTFVQCALLLAPSYFLQWHLSELLNLSGINHRTVT